MYASLTKNDGTFGGGNPWTASVELKTADSWGSVFVGKEKRRKE